VLVIVGSVARLLSPKPAKWWKTARSC